MMLVAGLAGAASGALKISVDGVVDPPDSEINLLQNDTLVLAICGDGATAHPQGALLLVQGPGSIEGGDMLYTGALAEYVNQEDFIPYEDFLREVRQATGLADIVDCSLIVLADHNIPPAPLRGILVDGIIFRCEGIGDVTLTLMGDDLVTVLDTQVIHQIPEPMSLALLGLGAMFTRRYRER